MTEKQKFADNFRKHYHEFITMEISFDDFCDKVFSETDQQQQVSVKPEVKPEIANDWISVKDRLPGNEETIIVYILEMDRPGHRPIQFARYVKSIDRFFIEGTPTEWFINYWQPLMNKPE